MISNEQHDVVGSAGKQRLSKRVVPSERVGLSEFDGQSMAVILHKGQKRIVLRGMATFVRDDTLGNSLQVQLDDSDAGQPILILSEDEWNGRIIPDFHHGCDFCLVIG